MFSLIGISLVINVLLFVVLVYLFFLRLVDKGVIDNLASKIKVREAEIKSLKEFLAGKERRLYTFKSAHDHIENVVNWGEYGQRLKLTLDDGSIHFISTPSEYGLIIQVQSEEGTDK